MRRSPLSELVSSGNNKEDCSNVLEENLIIKEPFVSIVNGIKSILSSSFSSILTINSNSEKHCSDKFQNLPNNNNNNTFYSSPLTTLGNNNFENKNKIILNNNNYNNSNTCRIKYYFFFSILILLMICFLFAFPTILLLTSPSTISTVTQFKILNNLFSITNSSNNNSSVNKIDGYTSCKVLPIPNNVTSKEGRALVLWKYTDIPCITNYTIPLNIYNLTIPQFFSPISNDKINNNRYNNNAWMKFNYQSNNNNRRILSMRVIFGETKKHRGKVIGFIKDIPNYSKLNKYLLRNNNNERYLYSDDLIVNHYLKYNTKLPITERVTASDIFGLNDSVFYQIQNYNNPYVYVTNNPVTYSLTKNNTSNALYFENLVSTFEFNVDNDAKCRNDLSILPLSLTSTFNSTTNITSNLCNYFAVDNRPQATIVSFEKFSDQIGKYTTFNESLKEKKFFIFIFSNSSRTFIENNFNIKDYPIDIKTDYNDWFLLQEMDFSKEGIDKDCERYYNLYHTSVIRIYVDWRIARHSLILAVCFPIVFILISFKDKQPIKSRFLIAAICLFFCFFYGLLGILADVSIIPTFDAFEYAFYSTLGVLYLTSMVRYMFVRNLYRVIHLVDNLETTFEDKEKDKNIAKRISQLNILSKLASHRVYISIIILAILIVNIPTVMFLIGYYVEGTFNTNTISNVVIYVKLISMVACFLLPGLLAVIIDLFINRKRVMPYCFKQTEESLKEGWSLYFGSFDDPLFYRIEFILAALLNTIFGVSTFIVGVIDLQYIPTENISIKTISYSIHGILFLLFELSYVLLTCGFVTFVQIVRFIKTRNMMKKDQNVDNTLMLLKDTLKDADGRELFHHYCKRECSLENLLLYERSAKILKQLLDNDFNENDMNRKIEDLYNNFIKIGACMEVTLSFDLRHDFIELIESSYVNGKCQLFKSSIELKEIAATSNSTVHHRSSSAHTSANLTATTPNEFTSNNTITNNESNTIHHIENNNNINTTVVTIPMIDQVQKEKDKLKAVIEVFERICVETSNKLREPFINLITTHRYHLYTVMKDKERNCLGRVVKQDSVLQENIIVEEIKKSVVEENGQIKVNIEVQDEAINTEEIQQNMDETSSSLGDEASEHEEKEEQEKVEAICLKLKKYIESKRITLVFLRGMNNAILTEMELLKTSHINFGYGWNFCLDNTVLNEMKEKSNYLQQFCNKYIDTINIAQDVVSKVGVSDTYITQIASSNIINIDDWYALGLHSDAVTNDTNYSTLLHKKYKIFISHWYGFSHGNEFAHDLISYLLQYLLFEHLEFKNLKIFIQNLKEKYEYCKLIDIQFNFQ
ncbi:hypothetical protein ABK040_005750 [Willaertia magna]